MLSMMQYWFGWWAFSSSLDPQAAGIPATFLI
jgi:hypothetical protein